ncbi:glycosyltransferase family 4 protein, partial [Salmonella enterica subsp. enterica serovar Schwarzengrund]|nr:glycosyltransferase family 4 protein [Salmonella enterica subsp. enterica serovar Schwarzengrund]
MIVNLSRLGKSGTGMWQYSIKFLTALREIADVDAIICSKVHADYFEKLGYAVVTVPNIVSNTSKTSRLRPLVWYAYSYWLALRVLIKFGNKKLVCTTHHTIPLLRNQTITVHDIRPFYYPDSFIQKVYFRFLLKMSVKRCKHVLTVSYTVKDSIAKTYNVDSEKISVIYNSVNKSDFIQKKEKENYFLAVGASWAHKNIHSFIKNKKVWSDSYNLIIVCGRTDYAMSLQQMVVDLELTDKVIFLHEVSFNELKVLYSKAYALVYPSIDEGFGIPPIEAMASNTPVIVSDIPVFHEVLTNGALYVNPDDEKSWQSAIENIEQLPDAISRFNNYVARYDFDNMKQMVGNWLA